MFIHKLTYASVQRNEQMWYDFIYNNYPPETKKLRF